MDVDGLTHLGFSTMGDRPDGLQVVGSGSRVFVSHLFSNGFSEIDIVDPRNPRLLSFTPAPAGTWSLHLQVQGDLLIVTNGPDMWSMPADFDPGRSGFATGVEFSAGVRFFDVTTQGSPRQVSFVDLGGAGAHRAWFDESDVALISAVPPGFDQTILLALDVSDPTVAFETSRDWIAGMAPGEERDWPQAHNVSLHHATGRDGYAYGAWRDGGISIQEVDAAGDLGAATRLNWQGPGDTGCAAHSAVRLPGTELLAVAEEGVESEAEPQERDVVLLEISDPSAPRRVGALPRPECQPVRGARFGPHNLYEYRTGGWSDGGTVFVAHQGAGLRVYDVAEDGTAQETRRFIPDPPTATLDPRPLRALVPQTNDVFVTPEGLLAVVDANCGLHLLELDDA